MEEQQTFEVSGDALDRMRSELEDLKTRGRGEMGERLRRAREFGDIRENADYDAAKDDQALMEARIRKLEHLIRNAVVRETAKADVASVGVLVTVRDEGSGETEDYFLASSNEDRVAGAITVTPSSPMGAALMGRRSGDMVIIEAPGGSFSVEIVSMRPG